MDTMNDNPPDQAAQTVDEALNLIQATCWIGENLDDIQLGTVGHAEAKAALLALMYQERIDELKMVDPIASHRLAATVDERIEKLEAKAKRFGQKEQA